MRFIAFDLETTGTLPGVDQIVEIGAVRFDEGGEPEAETTVAETAAAPRRELFGEVNDLLTRIPSARSR